MSSSPRNKDENDLKLVPSDEDPMQSKVSAYGRALDALPRGLQQPIAEYVKQHVELELAPAPVTRATYLVHLLLCLLNYLLMVGVFEVERHSTINSDDFTDSLSQAFVRTLSIWGVSVLLAMIMRIQTRAFKLSQVLVASTCGYLGFVFVTWANPVINFFIVPRWISGSVSDAGYFCVFIFWLHWYLASILPTTRKFLVKVASISICTAVCVGLFAANYKHAFDKDVVPEMGIIPFTGALGAEADLGDVLEKNLAAAVKNAPEFKNEHLDRGRSFIEAKRYDDAMGSFYAAIELNPSDWNGYFFRSQVFMEKGDLDRAMADFDIIDRLRGDQKMTSSRRAVVYFAKKKFELAAKEVDIAIGQEPKASTLYTMKGIIALYMDKTNLAAESFSKAMAVNPKDLTPAIWQEISNRKAGVASRLKEQVAKAKRKEWSRDIASLYLRETKVDQLFSAIANYNSKAYTCEECKKCDAAFFSAQWELLEGRKDAAAKLFKEAEAVCDAYHLERYVAALELKKP